MAGETKPLPYGSGLNLEEARQRYAEAAGAFTEVRGRYSGPFSRFRRTLAAEDKKLVVDGSSALCSLSTASSVQAELNEFYSLSGSGKDSLFCDIQDLFWEICLFQGRFRNTGVKVYRLPAGSFQE